MWFSKNTDCFMSQWAFQLTFSSHVRSNTKINFDIHQNSNRSIWHGNWIQSTLSLPVFIRFTLIIFSYLYARFPSDLVSLSLSFVYPISATRHASFNLIDLINTFFYPSHQKKKLTCLKLGIAETFSCTFMFM